MPLTLRLFPQVLAICTLPPETDLPMTDTDFYSITRTPDELSLVLPETDIPPGATSESGWRCFYVEGSLPFDAVGILAGLSAPLAAADISIFSVSSYKTDYLLVRQNDLEKACVTLIYAGYSISEL